jgi:hypothetical protein
VRDVFRPWFGRALTIGVGIICAVSLGVLVATDGVAALIEVGPWLALVAGACWTTFWRPEVVVDDGGVQLVNVIRTVHLPWPAIQAVDTKWALTLITAYGRFTGWAAPAPGVHQAVRATRHDAENLPMSALRGDGVRPGDLPSSPSGDAALAIRRRMERLRDAGFLDDPQLEHEHVPTVWHTSTIVGAALLVVLGLAGLVV